MFQTRIEFINLERSEFIEGAVHRRLAKLARFGDEIMRCRVTVEAPHKHHGKGNVYRVSVDLHLPGKEILVNHDSGLDHAHEDVYVAIRDAVNAAARQVQDYVRVRRGKIKSHDTPLHGRISELSPDLDFGRIATSDGRSIYFHANSLLDAKIGDLAVGAEVRFDEEAGDAGPQATTVRIIGKHHIVE